MNDLVTKQSFNLEAIFLKAVEKDASVDTIERLMAMQKQMKEDWAREEYFAALSTFQSLCPVIKKEREVKNSSGAVRYRYASLDDIVKQISPILKDCGLSFTIKTEYKEGFIIAFCETHHVGGHSEISSFPVPIEKEAYMNEAQKTASAQTYAKRYAFCNAFGILTGDVDDDVKSLGEGLNIQDMYRKYSNLTQAIMQNYPSIIAIKDGIAIENLEAAAEAWYELDEETQKTLWVAPAKGGPFTTEERKIIKGSEFGALHPGVKGFGLPENYGHESRSEEDTRQVELMKGKAHAKRNQ